MFLFAVGAILLIPASSEPKGGIMRTRFLIILLTGALITLGQSAQAKKRSWISLFNGKDLTGWHLRNPAGVNGWKIQDGVYVNTPPSTDIQTDSEYYDFQLHVEFKVSKGDGNSGVYMRDRYEVQIFDSYGKASVDTDCGALYRRIAPAVNDNGQKVLDVSDVGPMGTGASSNRPDAPGPLRLQGDHDAVSFRNIRIRPLSKSEAEKLIKE